MQETYDELDDIVRTLDGLIERISNKNYIDQLRETLYEATNELEEIQPKLEKQYANEEQERQTEYVRSVL